MKIFLLILGACLIIAAAMAFVAMPVIFILPEYFSSTAQIALDKSVPDLTSPDPVKIQTELAVMQSSTVLYPVITNLNLSRIWAMKFRETSDLRIEVTHMILKGQLEVRQSGKTGLIEIRVTSEDKIEASVIANEIAKVYCQTGNRAWALAGSAVKARIIETAQPALRPFRNGTRAATGTGAVGILCAITGALLIWRSLRKRTIVAPPR